MRELTETPEMETGGDDRVWHSSDRRGRAMAVFYVVVLAWLYHPALCMMVSQWNREDYNYCYLIPFLCGWLFWTNRERIPGVPAYRSWVGMGPLLFGVALFWLGELGGEYFTLYISAWFSAVGLLWLHQGWGRVRAAAFPILFALAMFPLPHFLHQALSFRLKLAATTLGVGMMRLWGVSAYQDGNIIDLGFTKLQVVDACGGLRYLVPLFVLGILIAWHVRGAFWKKALVALAAVPLSVAANSFRIAMTGILYESMGARVAEGFFHGFSGWLLFMVSVAVLAGIAALVNRFSGKPRGEDSGVDRDLGESGKRFPAGADSRKVFAVAAVLLLATLGVSTTVEFRESVPPARDFAEFPMRAGKWSGHRDYLDRRFVEALDFSDYVIADYVNPRGEKVNLYLAYYESQRKGESIHSPASCLPGGGWKFTRDGVRNLPTGNGVEFPATRATMRKGDRQQLVYYWFPQRGRIVNNLYALKFFVFWDALVSQRTDGALVRVITPVYPFENMAAAQGRLDDFLVEFSPILDSFLPGQEAGKDTRDNSGNLARIGNHRQTSAR
ncbi:MAG: VPLPA-CTERM-specific exosortase XrtD [Desulfatibacillaceae bacterium]